MKRVDSSVQSTSSVLAALDSDKSDVEVLSVVSESEHEYDNISKTESDQGTELEMNKSSDSMPVPSLLSVLRVPKLSDLTRKKKVQCNPGKHKKVHSSSSTSSEPKGVTPQDRVKKFRNEQLSVSAGRLFCKACREELSLKSSSLMNHLKSQKHKDGKKRLDKKEAGERDIVKELAVYNENTHMVGETIAGNMQVFCVKVLSTFLRAGVPLNKLELFRELFEENGYCLTDRHNMYDLLPFIQKRESNITCTAFICSFRISFFLTKVFFQSTAAEFVARLH